MAEYLHYNRKNLSETKLWVGVVEDRSDPLGLGRVRVRIHGYHSPDKKALKTEHLQWAVVLLSNRNDPPYLMIDDKVMGVWADWPECQIPVVIGVIPRITGNFNVSKDFLSFDPKSLTILGNYLGFPVMEINDPRKLPAYKTVGSYPLRNGAYHPQIQTWINQGGGLFEDEVPWVAAWASVMSGIPSGGTSRGFLSAGKPSSKPEFGDLIVLSNPPKPDSGHVGFYVGSVKDRVILLTALSSTTIGVGGYDIRRVIGVRKV